MMKYILPTLALGILAGYLNNSFGIPLLNTIFSEHVFNFSLIALLFLMGLLFAADKQSMGQIRKAKLKILLFPLAVALGSLSGGFIGGLILRIDMLAAMGVCAGYGWYTLAGPLVGQLFGLEWGALAFIVNFLRELFTTVATAIVVKVDKYAPIAMGGATTMDTTLPIIMHYCGQDTLIIAFSSGFTLTMAAPFTITGLSLIAH